MKSNDGFVSFDDNIRGKAAQLFGAPVSVRVSPPTASSGDASERIVSEVYDRGMVDDDRREPDGTMMLEVWLPQACQAQLKARWADRIDIK